MEWENSENRGKHNSSHCGLVFGGIGKTVPGCDIVNLSRYIAFWLKKLLTNLTRW